MASLSGRYRVLERRSLVFTFSMFSITSPFDSCQNRRSGGVHRLIFFFFSTPARVCVCDSTLQISEFTHRVGAEALQLLAESGAQLSWPPSTEVIAATRRLEVTKYCYFVTIAVVQLNIKKTGSE